MNDSPEFSIYPRGFLGDRVGEGVDRLIQRPDPIFRMVQHTFKFPQMPNVKAYSNKAIDSLYAAYINRNGDTTSMAYREKVLKCALSAFGTDRFDLWYSKQFVSPSVGDTHHRFLDDTLRFIATGQRGMYLDVWRSLLRYNDEPDTRELLTPAAADFFGINTPGVRRQPVNASMVEIIQRWTAQPNGFEDLLCTMHILFGALD
jgi:hypothetical protein